MKLSTFFNREFITHVSTLSDEEKRPYLQEQLKKLIDLKPLSTQPYEIYFAQAWNRFASKTFSQEDLDFITECFYNDQNFRSLGLGKEDEKWRIENAILRTEPIRHTCKKTLWDLYLNINKGEQISYKDDFREIQLNDEVFKRYELAKLFCLENIKAIRAEHNKGVKGDAYVSALIKATKPMLLSLDHTKLKRIDSMGYEVVFFSAWNKLVDGQGAKLTEQEWYYLGMPFSHDLYMKELSIKDNVVSVSRHLSFSSSDQRCRLTDTKFMIELNPDFSFSISQWVPEVRIVNGEKHHWGKFIPMQPMSFKDKIYEKTITFKTGNLIINDWFETENDSFSEAVDDDFLSLESAANRVEVTKKYLKDFKFIHVSVLNTCPGVYQEGDKIFIGQGPDKAKNKKGFVCTDLWWASIIEEEQFLKILTTNGVSKEQADKDLAAVKKTWTCTSLKVSPGKYKLKFMGDHEKFAALYKGKAPKGVTPYFTLEKVED